MNQAIDAIYKFFEFIHIPMHLKEVGIDESRMDEMAKHVAENEGLENAWVPLFQTLPLFLEHLCNMLALGGIFYDESINCKWKPASGWQYKYCVKGNGTYF